MHFEKFCGAGVLRKYVVGLHFADGPYVNATRKRFAGLLVVVRD